MTTRHAAVFTVLALAATASAAAQTPPVVQVPVQIPNPVVAPLPVITPKVVTLPELPMVVDLSSLQIDTSAIQLVTRDAMDLARMAVLNADLSLLDWQQGQGAGQGQGQGGQSPLVRYAVAGGSGYTSGLNLLAAYKYDQAIVQFDRVVAQKGTNADGALYWKAYAQFKLGKTDDAVTTIGALRKDFASSRYLGDAKVLEADARRRAGQPVNPASIEDDDLKILAINAMKNTDPERAIPLLEGVLGATNALRVKKNAIYVLASIPNPKARQILMNYAKGAGNPDLQIEAIRYVAAGSEKTATAADLMQIYQSTQDTAVRLAVINALGNARARSELLAIAQSGQTPLALRSSAMRGSVLSPSDLWTLYEKETNKELKTQLVGLLGNAGSLDHLTRIIKTEKDPDVVRRAIRSLGDQPTAKTGQMLVDMYSTDQDQQNRMAVINALGSQDNADGLVAIARKEASLTLKKEIVRRLSDLAPKSKVAADYLMEIIK